MSLALLNRLIVLLAPVLLISFYSCKKPSTAHITIEGYISDANGPVSDAQIQLSVKEITSGTYSNTVVVFHTDYSNSDGNYCYDFEAYNAIEYKIDVTGLNRFSQSLTLDADELKRNDVNTYDFELIPQGWYKIFIENTSPVDSLDLLQYQITSSQPNCNSCCENTISVYVGDTVNTSDKCMTIGNATLNISWIVTKNGFSSSYSNSINCNAGDTAFYYLNY